MAALVARVLAQARSKTRATQRVRGKPFAAAVAELAAGLIEAVQHGRKAHEERADVAVFALNTGLAHLISLVRPYQTALISIVIFALDIYLPAPVVVLLPSPGEAPLPDLIMGGHMVHIASHSLSTDYSC